MPTRSLARAVAPLLAVLMTGCDGAMESETLEARSRASQQAAGLRLPASAKVVFAHRMRGLDDAAQIVALMPTADWQVLEHWIEATVPGTQPPSVEDAAYLGTDHDGWTPGREPHLSARQIPWRDGVESLNIGSAPAGPGMVRVFIFWFQT